MGLFDKKYCDICGDKIGLLGNRKLANGNMCKNCGAKLSRWFSERKESTVEEIKGQLDYRAANQDCLRGFHATRVYGDYNKLMVDDNQGLFCVSRMNDIINENPDVISVADVISVSTDVQEHRRELREPNQEAQPANVPKRYTYDYDFEVVINVNHPYFDTLRFKINNSSVEVGEIRPGESAPATGFGVRPMGTPVATPMASGPRPGSASTMGTAQRPGGVGPRPAAAPMGGGPRPAGAAPMSPGGPRPAAAPMGGGPRPQMTPSRTAPRPGASPMGGPANGGSLPVQYNELGHRKYYEYNQMLQDIVITLTPQY